LDQNEALSELAAAIGVPDQALKGILRLFYNEYACIRKRVLGWIEQNNQQALAAYIHKLKGSSGSLQMYALRHNLIELEERLNLGETLSVEDFESVYSEMELVIQQYQLDRL